MVRLKAKIDLKSSEMAGNEYKINKRNDNFDDCSLFLISITLKTDLQDCQVGIECFKCVVDFLLKLPNRSNRPNIFRKRIP